MNIVHISPNISQLYQKAKKVKNGKPTFDLEAIKKAGIESAIFGILVILLTHGAIFLIASSTLEKSGIGKERYLIVATLEILMSLAFVAASKGIVAKKQTKANADDILLAGRIIPFLPSFRMTQIASVLFVVLYTFFVVYTSTTKTIAKANIVQLSAMDSLKLKAALDEFSSDTAKAYSIYVAKKSTINAAAQKETERLQNELAVWNNDFKWRKNNGYDYSTAQSKVKKLTTDIAQLKSKVEQTPQYLENERTYALAKSEVQATLTQKTESITQSVEAKKSDNIFIASITALGLDLIVVLIVFLQKFIYYQLIVFLTITNLSIVGLIQDSFKSEPVPDDSAIESTEKREKLNQLEVDAILLKYGIKFHDLYNWKTRGSKKLELYRKEILTREGVWIDFPDNKNYPHFFKAA